MRGLNGGSGALDFVVGSAEGIEDEEDRGVGGVDVDDAWNREEGGEIGRVRGEVEKERLVAGITKHSIHGAPER